ncbi:MAG TPA: mandelate racemase/muconate lactonizing enzyme family protein, partial [Microbacterium sp.]|nr:mandelate racemase/muconate lactonizing enzyme family protein [Microbacterium sp.]
MKITGYRTLRTVHDWGRPVGDVNGFISSGVTDVPIVVLETDEGIEGIGMGSHADLERLFPALEGQDPRAVSSLYDAMLARVFKSSHAGATFGGVGAFDTALWDLKAKIAGEPLWRLLGAADRFVPGYASALDIALSDDELGALYGRFAERGFTSAKLKGGRTLERDIERFGIVRQQMPG